MEEFNLKRYSMGSKLGMALSQRQEMHNIEIICCQMLSGAAGNVGVVAVLTQ